MSRYRVRVAVVGLVAVCCLLVGAGCPRGSPRVVMPPINSAEAGKTAIADFDADKNGSIDQEELGKCPSLKMFVRRVNPNGDGSVSGAQIASRIKQLQAGRVGLMPRAMQVMHNGKPFEGATVKLVPERFMGDKYPVCTATVGAGVNGLVSPSKPIRPFPDDCAGVPPGFYRIEITKDGEDVPAKYNTESIYGVEVAPDFDPPGVKINVVY